MKRSYFSFTMVGMLFLLLIFSSCEGDSALVEAEEVASVGDTLYLDSNVVRAINYSVLVATQSETNYKSSTGVTSAVVSLAVGDSVISVTTDASGLAAFNNLRGGTVAVSVSLTGHSTANFIVDLTSTSDIDSDDTRYAATMVVLMPVSNLGVAYIKGHVSAELDNTNFALENAPAGTKLVAQINYNTESIINPSTDGYVNHSGDGEILSFYYEGIQGTTTASIDNNGDYSIIVPANSYGFDITVYPNDFEYYMVTGIATTSRQIYEAASFTVTDILRDQVVYYDFNY